MKSSAVAEETAPPVPNHLDSGQEEAEEEEVAESSRSRASSVISTGTRMSILTLPQSDSASQRNVDGILTNPMAASTSRLVPRPMSIYSFRSMGEVLPPYSEIQPAATTGIGSAAHRPQISSGLLSNDTQGDIAPGNQASTIGRELMNETSEENVEHGHNNAGKGTEHEDDDDDDGNNTDDHSPPTSPLSEPDPENAIARHYGTIVRTIDENNKQLITRMAADHAQELATLRNAIDAEYRKVLRSRNQELERNREASGTRESALEARIVALEAQLEAAKQEGVQAVEDTVAQKDAEMDVRCAKARHLVEDLWEERWQKRNELAAEEARRSEREWKETVRLLVEEERERWEGAVERSRGVKELEFLRRVLMEEEKEEEQEGEGEEGDIGGGEGKAAR